MKLRNVLASAAGLTIFINIYQILKLNQNKMEQTTSVNRDRYIHIEAKPGKHTHTLIFMYGLGDSAHGFEDVFAEGGPLNFPNLRVVLPTAPERPVTCNGGMKMNSWFDIHKLSNESDMTAI